MLNDVLLPVGRYNSEAPMPELKSGQMVLKKGDAVNFDELYVGTSRGNSLINPRAIVKAASEPAHSEGLEWIELDGNGQPKYDFAWTSRNGLWIGANTYQAELHASSQDDIQASKLIDLPYFGTPGIEPAFYLEESRLIIVSDVEAEEPMGHQKVGINIGGLDVFNDDGAIEDAVQGSQLAGPSLRRSFNRGEVVQLADYPVFGLEAVPRAGSTAFSSVSGSIAYRLVRQLPFTQAEDVVDSPEQQQAPG